MMARHEIALCDQMEIERLIREGVPAPQIARRFHVSGTYVYKRARALGIKSSGAVPGDDHPWKRSRAGWKEGQP